VRRSSEIQFAPLPPVEAPESPRWIEWLGRLLDSIFGPAAEGLIAAWPVIDQGLLALALMLALYLAWRLVAPWLSKRRTQGSPDDTWTLAREEALALLEDADRLAARGLYDEAAHLLLQRSVGQIRLVRPE